MYRLGVLIILVSLLGGCSPKSERPVLIELEKMEENREKQVELVKEGEIEKNDFVVEQPSISNAYQVTDQMFLTFFKRYFSLSLEQILILNQNPMGLVREDKVIYEEKIKELKEILFPYLSEQAMEGLGGQGKGMQLHLPKLLEINNYITIGSKEVEAAKIISARPLGENTIYEVEVTTRERVIDIIEANKRYAWDENKKYYIDKRSPNKDEARGKENAFETAYNIEEELRNSYLFLQETPEDKEDEIRLVHRYWVEARPQEGLVIESIEEANPFIVQEDYRQRASSNQYITRIPYDKEAMQTEEQVIKEVFLNLFSWTKDFFKNYEKIIQQDYAVVREFFDTLEIKDKIIIPKKYYKNAYHPSISPYKDNIEKIDILEEYMYIEMSVYGTKKQPRFNVSIPVKVLQKNNQIAYYEYKYLVGFEKQKVEFIHFLKISQMTLREYGRLAIE